HALSFSLWLLAPRLWRAAAIAVTVLLVRASSSASMPCKVRCPANHASVAGLTTPRAQNKGRQRAGAIICALRLRKPVTTALARASGVIVRRNTAGNAVSFMRVAKAWPPKAISIMGVAVHPGYTTLALAPVYASSTLKLRARDSTAAFDAA